MCRTVPLGRCLFDSSLAKLGFRIADMFITTGIVDDVLVNVEVFPDYEFS